MSIQTKNGKKGVRLTLPPLDPEAIDEEEIEEDTAEVEIPVKKNKFKINIEVIFYVILGLVILSVAAIVLKDSILFVPFTEKPKIPTPIIVTLTPTPLPTPTITPTPTPTPIVNKSIVGRGFFGWYDTNDPTDFTFACPTTICPKLEISHTYYICATGSGINGNNMNGLNETLYKIEKGTKKLFSEYPACVMGNYKLTSEKIGYLSQNIRRALFPFSLFPILSMEIYDSADGKPSYPIFNIAIP